ncbi:L-ascorbate metabolism protein UlaG, beta-lactamase superfamily [Micromonospora pattaloongensis]|uniref:L-ascorbate metabolism protein UlaG, beta-lactamase superfamily n=1 Tax=Micromonospora pattaloongensis TaxID=405436 RepID=A0A1H3Q997_9ACTN|nr:MBL fold metallo-hydrolase [Micromonospora pattaloongensis]SDZ09976.1 L-ascorbate metabolism protein UlaG, beta-lactamase superfamily [Micromonospora pattaloongensis]
MSDATATSTVTFVGTATTILRLGPFTLLTDPNFLHFGQRAYLGYGLWTKRRTDPAIGITQLPPLDGVVLSHLHGDHFDRVARHGLMRSLPIVTTPAAQRKLRKWGFGAAIDLRTWRRHEMSRDGHTLRITALPGRHGPGLLDYLLPEVMGSMIDLERDGARQLRLYVTGDTLNRPMLAEIPERFPEIDAMLIHLGGTRIAGILLTMDGRQGADLVDLIRPGVTVPIHYDDYRAFRSPLSHFLDAARQRGLLPGIRPILRGETIALSPHASSNPGR